MPAIWKVTAGCGVLALTLSASGNAWRAHAQGNPNQELLTRYCAGCHSSSRAAGGLAFDRLDPDAVGPNAAQWEKVVLKLKAGTMPPPGLPRPDAGPVDAFLTSLELSLDRASLARPNPGRTPAHRLNRLEYTNAVRDLLGLEIDGRALLPADSAGYGFDNIADVLTLSPALLERYMGAASRISRLAIGDATLGPEVKTYSVRPTYVQSDRMNDDLPFGTRGGIAVDHFFPLDGEYRIKIRLQRTHLNSIRGLAERNDMELRVDGARLKLFAIGGDGRLGDWKAVTETTAYELTADDHLELQLPLKAGTHAISAAFIDRSRLTEGTLDPRLSVSTYEYAGDRDTPMGVQTLEISGPSVAKAPVSTITRQRVFVCTPARVTDEDACARRIVSTLARRAFRRPATPDDVDTLLGVYRSGRERGRFDAGIELALQAVLVDPNFLFRVERDPPGAGAGSVHAVSPFELASRLSFFLWSSIPDDRLLDLAEQGTLAEPRVLEQEVARMLADPRATTLVTNFAGQWLYLRNIATVAPDPQTFPEFDENLREAMRRETELFLEAQLRENRSVLELLTADYTFLNERLARHYGIPNVYGSHFRRVTLENGRRGLLSHASILTATSYANRTSPTLRGKWILENLLGTPPPPPPPNVPTLSESDERGGQGLSVRARLEAHRQNATCASCHAQMDPLGIALENFDAIGHWRTTDGGVPIDAAASLSNGVALDGLAGVQRLLLARRDRFVETITEKLLTYGLGRGVEYYDAPAVRHIARLADAADDHWHTIILGIVTSTPFTMRRAGT